MGSVWGNALKISIFGESHGNGIGVVLDGFPAGIVYDEAFIFSEMARRAPGKNKQSTARKESDLPRILSGIYQGYTTGTPICAVIENTDTRSGDYKDLKNKQSTARKESDLPRILSGIYQGYTTGTPICAVIENTDTRSGDYKDFSSQPRPGHADYTGLVRFGGYNDPRGGGHFSGRLTAPLVFAGAMCKLYLQTKGITVGAHIQSIAQIQDTPFDDVEVNAEQLNALRLQTYPIVNPLAEKAMLSAIEEARLDQDSVGGVIECAAVGVPAGLGNPMLDTVEGRLSSLLFSVPAVKGVEFGVGFGFAEFRGSHANDTFMLTDDETVVTETNNNGGVLGGITSGMPLIFRTAIKPMQMIPLCSPTMKRL